MIAEFLPKQAGDNGCGKGGGARMVEVVSLVGRGADQGHGKSRQQLPEWNQVLAPQIRHGLGAGGQPVAKKGAYAAPAWKMLSASEDMSPLESAHKRPATFRGSIRIGGECLRAPRFFCEGG